MNERWIIKRQHRITMQAEYYAGQVDGRDKYWVPTLTGAARVSWQLRCSLMLEFQADKSEYLYTDEEAVDVAV